MFFTNEIGKKGSARFSQTLNLIPGRQYELSYFQGLLGSNADLTPRPKNVDFNCRASAQLNAVQVTQPLYPCSISGKMSPPGSCELVGNHSLWKTFYYEEVKAIVSSPIVETTLTISFDCDALPIPEEGHLERFAAYLLDTITMTLLN